MVMPRNPDEPFAGPLTAAIVAGSVGLLVGIWHGRGIADENLRRTLLFADLPPACEEMLRDGADAASESARRDDDEPFIP